jgi:2-methylcitrate dehydratase PrpD
VHGPEALLPIDAKVLADAAVQALAHRIRLTVDPAFEAMFSQSVPARVEVATQKQRFVQTVLAPKGEPSNPMSRSEQVAKLQAVARVHMSADTADRLLHAVEALDQGDIGPLKAVLALSFERASIPPSLELQAGE